ncbi:MAG: hypothetical protein FWH20_08325 [Oscillospiraceae bacterium]|nr:hypothetical protein [Oscillospiraceae bacterium]
MSVWGFLSAVCARCGEKRGLHKIKDGEWLCLNCLKEGEYKDSWADIQKRLSGADTVMTAEENEAAYQQLMRDAEAILHAKIDFDNGKITKEEYDEKARIFFGV